MKTALATRGVTASVVASLALAWAGAPAALAGLPAVSIKASDATAAEPGENTGAFVVTRTGTLDTELRVAYAVAGSASNGLDVVALPGSVTIPAGASNITISVQPVDDPVPEPAEYVTLSLKAEATAAYVLGTPASASVTVLDNDNLLPLVTLTVPTNGAVFTGPTAITIQARAADPDGWVRNINLFANGVFLGGSGTSNGSPGAYPTNGVPGFTFTWSNVLSGRFVLTATAYDNLGAMATSVPVNITVNLDPAVPVVKVTATDAYASEPGLDTGAFTLWRYGNTNQEVTVRYAVAGTATAGADYEALPGSAVIPANALSVIVPVLPLDDGRVEPLETVALSLLADPAYGVGDPRSATVHVRDNDTNTPPSVVMTAPTGGSTFKDPASVALAAEAGDADGSVLRVEFYVNGSLLAKDTNAPFTATWGSMPAGVYTLTAKAVDNMEASATSQPVTVTIVRTPMVRLSVTDASAAEPGSDTATLLVYRYNNTNEALTVFYRTGGTATAGSDYEALPGSVTLPAGVAVANLIVQPLDDALFEPLESVEVALVSNAAYAVVEPRAALVTIKDDEVNALPQVALTAPEAGATFVNPSNIVVAADAADPDGVVVRVEFYANNVLIGADTNAPYAVTWGGTSANGAYGLMQGIYTLTAKAVDNLGAAVVSAPVAVTVLRTPLVRLYAKDTVATEPGADTGVVQVIRYYNTNEALVVRYTIGGTASNGIDYVELPGAVTIPAGQTVANLVIQPTDDLLLEPAETIILTLLADPAYAVGDPRAATLYLRDNETNQPPSVVVTAPAPGSTFVDPTNILLAAEAADSDGTIRRVEFMANGVLVGKATNTPYAVRWANMAQGAYTITARALDNLEAAAVSAPVSVTVLRTPVVRLFTIDAYASETAPDCATVRVCRYYNTNTDLVVNYAIGGTAVSGKDYAALPGSLTIPAGQAYADIVVQPVDDALAEPTETVIIELLANAAYAGLDPRSAVVYIRDNDTNRPPEIALTAPADGAEFRNPTSIVVTAAATDADGVVARVDFLANNVLIGSSPGSAAGLAPTNGPWSIRWTPQAQGPYVLLARAFDNLGACATSLPVNVTVVRTPVVQVYATDAHAAEAGADPGAFTVYRRENTNVDVTVLYAVGGTAAGGIDYTALSGSVTLPAGALSAAIPVLPIDDGVADEPPYETVTVTLLANDAYRVTAPTQATVCVYNQMTTNVPPVVRLTAPTNGATFNVPFSTVLKAEAADADGAVVRVDFFADNVLVGSVSNAPYSVPWSCATAGYRVLTAKAFDNRGAAAVSAPVRILAAVEAKPAATRYLPAGYVPGVKLLVMIAVRQPAAFGSYSVADRPPTNWLVTAVGAGGVYDEAEDVVRFGPFPTNVSQVLTYEVVPPADAAGLQTFAGVLVTDGAAVPVGGMATIGPVPPHPADRNPADFVMTVEEAGAYCEAWKRALPGTSPVFNTAGSGDALSVSYVARAGYLSQGSGSYTVSTNYPTPVAPMVWVTNTAAGYTPLYASTGYGTAVCAMPTNYIPGRPFSVTITVTPAAGVAAYAVEERVPAGWSVSNVSDAGVFSATAASVKWGLFLDSLPATVSYDVTPGTNTAAYGAFSGVTSFDGVNTPITGVRKTYRVP